MRVFLRILLAVTTFVSAAAVHAAETADATLVRTVLFPFRQATLAAEVESSVSSHKFREGESFREKDLLLEMNDSSFKQKLIRADSSVTESKAGVEFSAKNLSRIEDLFKKGFQGQQDLEKAKLELDVAKSKDVYQKASLELAAIDLANCRIKAPFNGRVVKRMVQEHEYVRIGQPVVQIIDDNQLLAVMHLPSSQKNKIKLGEKLSVKVDETGTVHSGSVYEIAGEVDSGSRTFEIKVLIDNRDFKLSSGMSGVLVQGDTEKSK